jgi:hypothetical protein
LADSLPVGEDRARRVTANSDEEEREKRSEEIPARNPKAFSNLLGGRAIRRTIGARSVTATYPFFLVTETDAVSISKLKSSADFRPVQMVVHLFRGTLVIRQHNSLRINERNAAPCLFPIFFTPSLNCR